MIAPVSKAEEATLIRGFKARCENVGIQYRTHLGLKDIEPLPARELAEYLGVWIWNLSDVPGLTREAYRYLKSAEGDEWSAVTVRVEGQDIVVLNPSHSEARQSNDLMHELAHIILEHTPCSVVVSESTGVGLRTFDKRQEVEADWLASCLLLPRPAVAATCRQKMETDVAADYFGVSKELYIYRVRMTGVQKQLAYRRI